MNDGFCKAILGVAVAVSVASPAAPAYARFPEPVQLWKTEVAARFGAGAGAELAQHLMAESKIGPVRCDFDYGATSLVDALNTQDLMLTMYFDESEAGVRVACTDALRCPASRVRSSTGRHLFSGAKRHERNLPRCIEVVPPFRVNCHAGVAGEALTWLCGLPVSSAAPVAAAAILQAAGSVGGIGRRAPGPKNCVRPLAPLRRIRCAPANPGPCKLEVDMQQRMSRVAALDDAGLPSELEVIVEDAGPPLLTSCLSTTLSRCWGT